MKKWLFLGLEHGKHKMYLEHLVIAGKKEMLEKIKIKRKMGHEKGTRTDLKEFPMNKAETI